MKLLFACAASFLLFTSGCADNKTSPVATKRVALDVKAAVGEKLLLSWQPQNGISAYHVFYQSNGVAAREIDSVQRNDPDFANPKQIIDSTNMESWPAKGSQACFYVVAEANGVLSDPSDQACVTMQ